MIEFDLDMSRADGYTVSLQELIVKNLRDKKVYIKSMPDLPESNKEIFIDFESDMILDEKGTELIRIDYLIGLLKCEAGKERYTSLLREDEEELSSSAQLVLLCCSKND